MTFRNRALGALAAVLAVVTLAGPVSAADRPYTEGTVSVVSSIKVLPGKMDAYTSWLQTGWKKSMEAQKAAGIIVGYAVYFTRARSPSGAAARGQRQAPETGHLPLRPRLLLHCRDGLDHALEGIHAQVRDQRPRCRRRSSR